MSLLDLSWVVTSLAQEEVTVRRYAFASYDANGRPIPRTFIEYSTVASVQPQAGETKDRELDSDQETLILHLYTPFALKLGDEVLTSFGRCQVERLHDRQNMGSFCKASAIVLDAQEPRP